MRKGCHTGLMTAAPIADLGPWTLDDWHRADQPATGRLELLAGWWIMSPAPEFDHQLIADELRHALRDQVDGYVVTACGVDVSSTHRDGLIPDVVVTRHRPMRGTVPADDVDLVVEVWSPGNRARERAEKRHAYAAAGVPMLWEVQRTTRGIDLHVQRLSEAAAYVLDDVVVLEAGPATVDTALGKIELDVQL